MTNVHQLAREPAVAPAPFEELWKLWPNKARKPIARAKYEAIIKGHYVTRTLDKDSGSYIELELTATAEQILAGARAYINSQIDKRTYRFFDDGRFIPHLATWLNGGRWEDHL